MLILLRRLFLLAARHSANFLKFALCSRTAASVALSATSQRTKFPHPLVLGGFVICNFLVVKVFIFFGAGRFRYLQFFGVGNFVPL